jgi:hypothetical protein
VLIETQDTGPAALHQLGRRVVVLEVNDHRMLLT